MTGGPGRAPRLESRSSSRLCCIQSRGTGELRRRRQSVAILASAALLSASLAAAADCAALCASAPPAALHVNSATMPCGHCVPQHRPEPQQKNPNCGTHCLTQATARKISIKAPQILYATHELLAVNNRFALERMIPESAPAQAESHSPPAQSGRRICRHTSLLRI